LKGQGFNYKNQGLICMDFIWWKDRLAICEKIRDSLEKLPAQPYFTCAAGLTWAAWIDLSRWLRSGGQQRSQTKGAAAG
jgi:hypothetical protein